MNLLTLLGPPDDAPHVLAVDDRLEAACALWPVGLATQVEAQLTGDGKLSLTRALLDGKAVVRHVTARDLDGSFANINTPDDLDQLKMPNG
jgi:molybdopterin-guanine dinucleotide biosynthesis protein A